MRAAPLAFALDLNDADARRTLRDVCRITHHDEEAYAGALAIAMAVQAAASGKWDGEDDLLRLASERLPDSLVCDRLGEMSGIRRDLPLTDVAKRFGNSGWVVESVPLAMYAARRVTTLGFEATLVEVVGAGGDADTIASMAGQIMGASVGGSALPQELTARLPELDAIERTVEEFSSVLTRRSQ
jgi:ADP-ribosylglycohydrolase